PKQINFDGGPAPAPSQINFDGGPIFSRGDMPPGAPGGGAGVPPPETSGGPPGPKRGGAGGGPGHDPSKQRLSPRHPYGAGAAPRTMMRIGRTWPRTQGASSSVRQAQDSWEGTHREACSLSIPRAACSAILLGAAALLCSACRPVCSARL